MSLNYEIRNWCVHYKIMQEDKYNIIKITSRTQATDNV